MRSQTVVETKFYDDEGMELHIGDMITFFFGERQLVGKFMGTDKRNSWVIESKLGEMEATFHVKEGSIKELHKCFLKVGELDG